MNKHKILEQCEATLRQNDVGAWTRPAPGLYPHQWLWDSCFIAIGLRHFDVERAKVEIDSLFRGQWSNGLIPHITQSQEDFYSGTLWNKGRNEFMPKKYLTSGITQPPLLAEAFIKIGEKLSKNKRQAWYRHHFNKLLAYHEWLYRERDAHSSGLVSVVHPWESGMDNSPVWMQHIYKQHRPLWISLSKTFGLTNFFEKVRRDTRYVPAHERIDTTDALLLLHQIRKLINKQYGSQAINSSRIAMYDVLFNSVLIRNNQHLQDIADEIGTDVPAWLQERFKKAETGLAKLWSESDQRYHNKVVHSGKFAHEISIASLMPLYSGAISKKRAEQLAHQTKESIRQTTYPLASTPVRSPYFKHHGYWQGPVWVNANWLIIEGLKTYGYKELALELAQKTIALVNQYGPYEYFSPIDGTPAGAHQFSWSAALSIDLVKSIY